MKSIFAAAMAAASLASTAYAQAPTPAPTPAPKVSVVLVRPEINAAQADKDIQAGKLRFYTYGLLSMRNISVANILKKEYGIDVVGAAGCVVTRDLVNRVREYNERMDKAVVKKYGKTYSQLYEQTLAKVPQGRPVNLPRS